MSEREITAPLEVDELRAGWAAVEAERPRVHATLRIGARTDLGCVRENNEDKYDVFEPEEPTVLAARGRVYAVADGMGGHAAGQIASEVALKALIHSYYREGESDAASALRRAVDAANQHVWDIARSVSGRSGMGTTLVAAVVREATISVAHVGDSRVYRWREGRLEQLTEDHTLVNEAVRAGRLSADQAAVHPQRNVITRSLGVAGVVEPDLLDLTLASGDRFLLCSDGLTTMVEDELIGALLGHGSPSEAAWSLVDRACAGGGHDNVTALVVHVESLAAFDSEGE
jgi:protein phosphatase